MPGRGIVVKVVDLRVGAFPGSHCRSGLLHRGPVARGQNPGFTSRHIASQVR
jgi:hypothetical protein